VPEAVLLSRNSGKPCSEGLAAGGVYPEAVEDAGALARNAYIKDQATKRWRFSERNPIYRTIMEFVNMLCDKPFARI
jgi:hypothetical protein